MDKYQEKENVKTKSRIPLPRAPLPALPLHLLKKLSDRLPLKTLADPNGQNHNAPTRFDSNTQSIAGPSTSRCQSRPKTPLKIDTMQSPPLFGSDAVNSDCNFVAYQDDEVIYISSEDEHDAKEVETTDKDGLANKRRISASTPARDTLQPARVKNIKRSLKRPHSRALQGITPLRSPEQGGGRAKRQLNFNQTVRERMQSPDFLQKSYTAILNREYTADIFSYLLEVETKPVSAPRVTIAMRAGVIDWLMKINGVDGNPATIQTAVWYLDAVLATGKANLEKIQLLAAACYWIAAKIHGPGTPASRLVQYANHAFTAEMLVEAEELTLIRLKFPRQPVIPHDYLGHFAWWCNRKRPGEIEVATAFICLCGMMVNKDLCREYPSVVAAASISNALLLLRKKELIPRLQSCPVFVAAEKKAGSLTHPCARLRHAIRVAAAKDYSFKFIFEQYGIPPKYVAQNIVSAANELAVLDRDRIH